MGSILNLGIERIEDIVGDGSAAEDSVIVSFIRRCASDRYNVIFNHGSHWYHNAEDGDMIITITNLNDAQRLSAIIRDSDNAGQIDDTLCALLDAFKRKESSGGEHGVSAN